MRVRENRPYASDYTAWRTRVVTAANLRGCCWGPRTRYWLLIGDAEGNFVPVTTFTVAEAASQASTAVHVANHSASVPVDAATLARMQEVANQQKPQIRFTWEQWPPIFMCR